MPSGVNHGCRPDYRGRDASLDIGRVSFAARRIRDRDCNRAMDLAHRLSSELRAAEERAREFEAEANYFRERAAHAEEWLLRIHGEVQQMFFQKNEQRPPVSQAK